MPPKNHMFREQCAIRAIYSRFARSTCSPIWWRKVQSHTSSQLRRRWYARVCVLPEDMGNFHPRHACCVGKSPRKILRKWIRASETRRTHAPSIDFPILHVRYNGADPVTTSLWSYIQTHYHTWRMLRVQVFGMIVLHMSHRVTAGPNTKPSTPPTSHLSLFLFVPHIRRLSCPWCLLF